MTQVKVSVCIPVYNCERYIAECIESVLSQSMQDFEIIILDNNSTDGTLTVAGRYKDPRIKILRNDTNIGMIGNWNRVLELANGRYIKLLPADDFLYRDTLKLQSAVLDADTAGEISLVCGRKNVISHNGKIYFARGFSRKSGPVDGKAAINKTVRSAGNIIGEPGAVMFRKSILEKSGYFVHDIFFTVDLDLWFKMLLHGKLYALADVVYAFRLQKDSASVGVIKKHTKDLRAFMRMVYSKKEFGLTKFSFRTGMINSELITFAKRVLYKFVLN